jgi:hypothetical protein
MPDGSSPPKGGPKALGDALDNAKPRKRKPREPDPPAPPPDDGDGYFGWPENCPVTPLGIDGKEYLFIDANKQFIKLNHRDFGGHGLSALYGKYQAYLDGAWPRTSAKGDVIGLDKDRAARSHIAECARHGVFDSDNKIRGVGAWTDGDGRLVWHLGDEVLVVEPDGRRSLQAVGPIGEFVYPQGVPQVRPATPPRSIGIQRFYELLQRWAWKRGELDARLQLGWIGCALIGGALRWRPAVWATGGQGTGKSTLHDVVLNPVLGGTPSVVQTADATGPGLYQALKNRSTPVVFDELEPNPEDRQRIEATIKLAKVSASGARIVRGSPDGTHKEFVARAEFLFSSILIPRLEPELAMRICVLELQALGDRKEPAIAAADMLATGAELRRVLVERWGEWPARLEAFRSKLREAGFTARVADTWGSLLAMADHLLSAEASIEGAPEDTFSQWIDQLRPHLEGLMAAAGADHARLLRTLLTTTADPYAKGQRWPLSTLISIAAGRNVTGEDPTEGDHQIDHERAARGLETLGLKYMLAQPPLPADAPEGTPKPAKVWCLAVVSDHAELNKLLRDTKWAKGVYSQTLLRIPGAWSTQQRVARRKDQCTMVPIDVVLPPEASGSDLLTQ